KEKAEKKAALLKANLEKFKAQKENITTLPSGLQYVITEKGLEGKIKETDRILADYNAYFEDGQFLGTSKLETAEALDAVNPRQKAANGYKAMIFEIGPDARMIPGLKEGLKQLN